MKKNVKTLLIASIMALGLVGCGSTGSQTEVQNEAETTVEESDASETGDTSKKVFRLGINGAGGSELYDGAAVAVKEGYLEEELNAIGYTLEISPFAGAGPEINEALAGDSIDAAIYGDFPGFTSKSKGIDTTVVAVVNKEYQAGILVGSADIQSPQDLEGKTLIVSTGTVMQYYWENYIEETGIDASSINIVNSTDPVTLLQTGDADAMVGVLYSAKYMESIGLGTVLDSGIDESKGATSQFFEVSTALLKENPELGVAINKALIRGYEAATNDPSVFYAALSTDTISAEIMESAYGFDPTLSYISPEITDESIEYYENLNNWLYDRGLITEKVDVASYFDTSYYEKAVEELAQ